MMRLRVFFYQPHITRLRIAMASAEEPVEQFEYRSQQVNDLFDPSG